MTSTTLTTPPTTDPPEDVRQLRGAGPAGPATPSTATDPPHPQPSADSEALSSGRVAACAPLLTLHSTSRAHSDLLTSLARHAFHVRALERWESLLRACEALPGGEGGAVLLDLDEAERSPGLRALGISAHRLVQLLARELGHRAVALVIVTTRDYAEVEDLMRAGVHALLHPAHDPDWRAEQIRNAAARRRTAGSAPGAAIHDGSDVVQRAVAAGQPAEPIDGAAVIADPMVAPALDESVAPMAEAVPIAP